MRLTYKGPHGAVEIAATGQTVKRGKTVDVEDKTVAEALLAQKDTWKTASPPKPAATTKNPKKPTPKGD